MGTGRREHSATFWIALAVSALLPTLLIAVLFSWFSRAPAGQHVSGLFQADMLTYLCGARMAAPSPDLLTYASPWDLRQPPRALLIQWPITLMGRLLQLGLSPAAVENLLRLTFGTAMYALLARIVGRALPKARWFWPAFLTIALGGGVAWVWALAQGASLAGLGAGIRAAERAYYWWFLDLFRQLFYPLELIQHCVAFGWVLAVGRRRFFVAAGLLLVAAMTNPFVAVLLVGSHAVCVLLAPKGHARAHAFALLVAIAFAVHYGLVIGHDPVLGAIARQHRLAPGFGDPLSARDTVLGHGLALLAIPVTLLDGRFRRRLRASWTLMPVVVLGLTSLALAHHARLPGLTPTQPLHFARGYPLFAGYLVLFAWLEGVARRGERRRRQAYAAALLCLPLALPDNLSFVLDQWRRPPARPVLIWPEATEALLRSLRARAGVLRLATDDDLLSRQICAMTPHRTLVGTAPTTPDNQERWAAVGDFLADPTKGSALSDLRVDAVAFASWRSPTALALMKDPTWRLTFQNERWVLFERVRAPAR